MEVRLPELSDAMASATLTAWLKKPGDPVTAGEPIAEVETDKTTVELEAPTDGVLADIRVPAGTDAIAVGSVLALVRRAAPGEAATQGGPAGNAGSPETGASVPRRHPEPSIPRKACPPRQPPAVRPTQSHPLRPEQTPGSDASGRRRRSRCAGGRRNAAG